MSTPTMTGQDARDILVREVFAPAFFQKLAAHGVVPATDDEAVELLDMGQQLLFADQSEQVKKAGTRVDFLKRAKADLTAELNRRYGQTPAAPADPLAGYVKAAADQLGAHPLIQQAVETYNEAVAKAA